MMTRAPTAEQVLASISWCKRSWWIYKMRHSPTPTCKLKKNAYKKEKQNSSLSKVRKISLSLVLESNKFLSVKLDMYILLLLKFNNNDSVLKQYWDTLHRKGRCGSSVGRARDSWWGGPGLDFRLVRPLPTVWVGVSILWPTETEVMVSPLCLMCGSTYNCQTLRLGARPQYSLVVGKDVKKPTNQTNKQTNTNLYRKWTI